MARLGQTSGLLGLMPASDLEGPGSGPQRTVARAIFRTASARAGHPPAPGHDRALVVLTQLAPLIERLHLRLDTLGRHAADILFLQVSLQELVLGKRRDFFGRSRAMMLRAVAADTYRGFCSCCTGTSILDEAGLADAEYDHAFHRAVSRPEHGWLVCGACHGGYLARFEPFRPSAASKRPSAQRPRPLARARTAVRPPLPSALPGE